MCRPFCAMPYSKHVIERVNTLPASPGAKLARWAVYLDIPVTHIAFASGATLRTTAEQAAP